MSNFSFDPNVFNMLSAINMANPNSASTATWDNFLADQIRDKLAQDRSKPKHKIKYLIPENLVNLLKLAYPEFTLVFEPDSTNNHGVAAAVRTLDNHILILLALEYGSDIVDIGGNVAWYCLTHRRIHCCRPVLSAHDQMRMVLLLKKLTKLTTTKNTRLAQSARATLNDVPNSYMCHNKSQHCTRYADVIISCHSNYDMTVEEQCRTIISHRTNVLIGCFHFETTMLTETYGECEELGYVWRVENLKCVTNFLGVPTHHPLSRHPCHLLCNGHKTITFHFRRDPSLNYSHDYHEMMKYLNKTHFNVRGEHFVLELFNQRLGTVFYRITHIGPAVLPTVFQHTLTNHQMLDHTIVKVYRLIQGEFQSFWSTYPTDVVQLARGYGTGVKDEKITFRELYNYITGVDNTWVLGGVTVKRTARLEPQRARDLAISIYIDRTTQEFPVEQLRQIVQIDRRNLVEYSKRLPFLNTCHAALVELWNSCKDLFGFSPHLHTFQLPSEEYTNVGHHSHEDPFRPKTDIDPVVRLAHAQGIIARMPFFEKRTEFLHFREIVPGYGELPAYHSFHDPSIAQTQTSEHPGYVGYLPANHPWHCFLQNHAACLSPKDLVEIVELFPQHPHHVNHNTASALAHKIQIAASNHEFDNHQFEFLLKFSLKDGSPILGEYVNAAHYSCCNFPTHLQTKPASNIPFFDRRNFRTLIATAAPDELVLRAARQLLQPFFCTTDPRQLTLIVQELQNHHPDPLFTLAALPVQFNATDFQFNHTNAGEPPLPCGGVDHLNARVELEQAWGRVAALPDPDLWDVAIKTFDFGAHLVTYLTQYAQNPVTVGWCKAVELFFGKTLDVSQTLHLCESPGFYIQCLCDFHGLQPQDAYYATLKGSFSYKGGYAPFMAASTNIAPHREIDIFDREIFQLLNAIGDFSLVTCDSGATSGDHATRRTEVTALLVRELQIGMMYLRPGGTLLLKIYNLDDPYFLFRVLQASQRFQNVYLTKPETSREHNNERYLVMEGYGLPVHPDRYADLLNSDLRLDAQQKRALERRIAALDTPGDTSPVMFIHNWLARFIPPNFIPLPVQGPAQLGSSPPAFPPGGPPSPPPGDGSGPPVPPPPPPPTGPSTFAASIVNAKYNLRRAKKNNLLPPSAVAPSLSPPVAPSPSLHSFPLIPPVAAPPLSAFAASQSVSPASSPLHALLPLPVQPATPTTVAALNSAAAPVPVASNSSQAATQTVSAQSSTSGPPLVASSDQTLRFHGVSSAYDSAAVTKNLVFARDKLARDKTFPALYTALKSLAAPVKKEVYIAHFSHCLDKDMVHPVFYTDAVIDMSTVNVLVQTPARIVQLSQPLTNPISQVSVEDIFFLLNGLQIPFTVYTLSASGIVAYTNCNKRSPALLLVQEHAYTLGGYGKKNCLNLFRNGATHDGRWDITWDSCPPDGNCMLHALLRHFPTLSKDAHALRSTLVRQYEQAAVSGVYTTVHFQNPKDFPTAPVSVTIPVSVHKKKTFTFEMDDDDDVALNPAGGNAAHSPALGDYGYDCVDIRQYTETLQDTARTYAHVAQYNSSAREYVRYLSVQTRHIVQEVTADFNRMVGSGYLADCHIRAMYSTRNSILMHRVGAFYRPVYFDMEAHGEYDFAWDGKKLASLKRHDENSYVVNTDQPYVLVTDALRLFQGPRLLRRLTDINTVTLPFLVVDEGVPGAGKTTSIIERARDGDVIVTAFKKTAEETRAKLRQAKPSIRVPVYTIDSYLLNHRTHHTRVLVDEIYAVHFGSVAVVAAIAKASIVHGYGDPRQLRMISRVFDFEFLNNYPPFAFYRDVVVSNRCPADVCACLSRFYPGFLTRNPVVTSMNYRKITNVVDVPHDNSALYLTFTQQEKQELQKHLDGIPGNSACVVTVHESQGSQCETVHLVRLNTKKLTIYTSEPHNIVALTRHSKVLTFHTTTFDPDTVTVLFRGLPALVPRAHQVASELFLNTPTTPTGGALVGAKPFVCYEPQRLSVIDDVVHQLRLPMPVAKELNIVHRFARPFHAFETPTSRATVMEDAVYVF
jgi:hypothetical protein